MRVLPQYVRFCYEGPGRFSRKPSDFFQFKLQGLSEQQRERLQTLSISGKFFMAGEGKNDYFFLNKSNFNGLLQVLKELEECKDLFLELTEVRERIESRDSPVWRFQNHGFELRGRALIMGVLNVTPDSFSDGGDYYDRNRAVDRALEMVEQGADIIDIGGESTRPGAESISISEEIERTVPVIEAFRRHSRVPISIDTYKSEVAEEAIQAGANIINDISGARYDPRVLVIARRYDTGLILMHIQGTPKDMQRNPFYEDVVEEILQYLAERVSTAITTGIRRDHIVVDPGIGFGKRWFDNYDIINRLGEFTILGFPILVGVSRKSFLGKFLAVEPRQRVAGSLVANVLAVQNGASILRVHDVGHTHRAMKIADVFFKRASGMKAETIEEYYAGD